MALNPKPKADTNAYWIPEKKSVRVENYVDKKQKIARISYVEDCETGFGYTLPRTLFKEVSVKELRIIKSFGGT